MSLPVTPAISLRNILYATDFSPCSEAALRCAIGLSRRYHGVLNLVSVVSAEICGDSQSPDPFYLRHSAEDKMTHLVTSEIFLGINHQEFVEESEGNISLVLTELMRNLKTDLLVLGTHGRGGMKKICLVRYQKRLPTATARIPVIPEPKVHPKRASHYAPSGCCWSGW
jgi:nucleotide-binding universal stress UspA family protein